jgi:hypothetical protein
LSSKVDHLFHIKVLLVLSLIYPEKHWSIDIFKILVIWGAIIDLLHFIILAGIPSAPVVTRL